MSATPILDRELPVPGASRKSRWYSLVLGLAAGVLDRSFLLSGDVSKPTRRCGILAGGARKVKYAVKQQDWDSKAVGVIALAKGDSQNARESLQRYLSLLGRRPPSGMLASERARTVALLNTTA